MSRLPTLGGDDSTLTTHVTLTACAVTLEPAMATELTAFTIERGA